jgi:hypothetical protein
MPINASRFKAIWPWLAEVRYAWYSMAVIGVALIISLCLHPTEPVIRLTGLGLQLFGIGTVIWGISETRALFGHPSFLSKTKAWFRRFPLLRRNVVLSVDSASHIIVGGKATAYMTHGAGANPTIEARLDSLERNVTLIHERISQIQKETDKEFHEMTAAIKREEQSRHAEDNAIRMKLEATGTGGVHISAIGASLLFVGIILSTAATEIASLLK